MWAKLIAWLLAALTALFGGFAYFKNNQNLYAGDTGYEIQEEAVDYKDMRSWYVDSFGSSELCHVDRIGNAVDLNSAGFAYIVKGQQHNPDAKLEFVEGAVIIAPSRCKVMTQPDASGNKITVAWESSDYLAFRMEIINPAKWFCCTDIEPSATGMYVHSMEDHRITLEQGDTIAVCGENTTINMWRGDANGALAKVTTLREFLLYDANEKGDSTQIASGTQQPTYDEDSEVLSLPADKMWAGDQTWVQGAPPNDDKWWVGKNTEGGYPANQYMLKNNYYYYFDGDGWMQTGWADDGRYYLTSTDSTSRVGDTSLWGIMARSTIVPSEDGNTFVYVNDNGKLVEEGRGSVEVVGRDASAVTYDKQADGTYKPRSGATPMTGSDNFQGGSNISTQEREEEKPSNVLSTSDEVFDTLIATGELEGSTDSGWVVAYDERTYMKEGKLITNTPHDKSFSGSSYKGYNINGTMYVFDSDGVMLTDWEVLEDGTDLYLYMGLKGLLTDGWKQWEEESDGDWYYAIGSRGGALHTDLHDVLQSSTASGEVVFYLFDAGGVMRTDDSESVVYKSHVYKWRGEPYGSYDRVE